MDDSLAGIIAAVQHNCDISDARHAGDYTLCVYLMKMRELYRWTEGHDLTAPLEREAIGRWVQQRETELEALEEREYQSLEIHGQAFSPFDSGTVNLRLLPSGLVYSGGLGPFGKPCFFLGRLRTGEHLDDYSILISDEEFARELAAPPAMLQGRTIFIRRESLRRMLWERVEEWRWQKLENAMGRAVGWYEFDSDPVHALDRMTENELESMILHEIGELVASDLLGPEWQQMIHAVSRTPAEILARAVRDHLADCLSSLPALLSDENVPAIHFYFGNLHPLRRELFPMLNDAYRRWVATGNMSDLKSAVRQGHEHWLAVALELLGQHRRHESAAQIESQIRAHSL